MPCRRHAFLPETRPCPRLCLLCNRCNFPVSLHPRLPASFEAPAPQSSTAPVSHDWVIDGVGARLCYFLLKGKERLLRRAFLGRACCGQVQCPDKTGRLTAVVALCFSFAQLPEGGGGCAAGLSVFHLSSDLTVYLSLYLSF